MPTPAIPEKLHDMQKSALPADSSWLLQEIVQAVTFSTATGDALEALFCLLRDHCGARALALETFADSLTRLQPYGDTAALLETSLESATEIVRLPLKHPKAPPGHLLLALLAPFGTHSVSEDRRGADNISSAQIVPALPALLPLLETAALLIAQRLAQDELAKRAEEAESRAEQRISEVAAIYEIGQAIDQIEHPRLFQLITERAASLMDAQTCSLMVVQEETASLQVVASFGLPDDAALQEQKIGEGIAGRVAQTEQPMLIVGGMRDPRLEGMTLRPEINSSMLVPLKNPTGRVLGVLAIRRRRPAPDFNDSDLKVFSVFATQAALALTNKQLYDDLKRRAGELVKISSLSRALISTLNLEDLLRRVSEDICQIVGFDRCCLYLRDISRPLYSPRAWRGYSDVTLRNPAREGEGAVGMTARTKQMMQFDAQEPPPTDPEADRSYRQRKGFARSLGVNAFVAMPILDSKNRCLGVVVADNRGSRAPIPNEQVSLLSTFVNQAGIAIENARLYDTTQENLQNIYRLNNETENVLQSIGACILSTDARGVVTRWNRATETTLGQTSEALRGAFLTEVIARMSLPSGEQETLLQLVSRVQETGEIQYRAKWTLHPANRPPMTIDLHLSRLLDYNRERAGVVLTFEDVTKEVQLEAELDRMRRLADIGQLAAKMAHEVRNALSPIKGAAQIIRLDVEGQSSSTEWLDIIIAEVDGLSRLTSEMLDFARPKSLDRRQVRMGDLLHSAMQSLALYLQERNVQARCDIAPDLLPINADPAQLGQIIRNIVMNAAQSMQNGGELIIEAQNALESSSIVVRFRDTGIGIPGEDMERIFRPFVTTKTKGTGLGLSIVQKIVAQHGGSIEVDSQVGRGTCFSVCLPLDPPGDIPETSGEAPPLITSQPVGPFPDN